MSNRYPPYYCVIRVRPRVIPGWIGDHPDDLWISYYPASERMLAMRALSKTILFTRVKVGNANHVWPTAAFAKDGDAKAYAVAIKAAHDAGDAARAKLLDENTMLTEEGKLVPGIRFSIKIVPYAPEIPAIDSLAFEGESSGSL